CGRGAIDEAHTLERGAHKPDLLGREHVADHDLHRRPSVLRHIEHAIAAFRQVLAGAVCFLFVAGTIQNKDVTGPIPALRISIHRMPGRGVLQGAPYSRHAVGFDMRTSRKIWLGVGAFVVVETAATAAMAPLVAGTPSGLSARRVEPADGLAMD